MNEKVSNMLTIIGHERLLHTVCPPKKLHDEPKNALKVIAEDF